MCNCYGKLHTQREASGIPGATYSLDFSKQNDIEWLRFTSGTSLIGPREQLKEGHTRRVRLRVASPPSSGEGYLTISENPP